MATIYIDPSQVTNGDGSLATPYNTWASVVFAAGNDYLQKCGTTFNGSITVNVGGTSSAVRVKLGSYGTGDKPKINAVGQRWSIRVFTNINYVTIDNFECYGASQPGVTNFGIYAGGTVANVRITNCYIHDIGDNATGDCDGIWAQSSDAEIDNCIVDNVPDDGIWVEGVNARITNCRFTRIGTNVARLTGDGIQINGVGATAGAFYIANNYIDHANTNEKQGIIVSSAGSGSGGIIEGNTVIYQVISTGGTACIFIDQPGTIIRRNKLFGAPNCITSATNNVLIYGNIIDSAYVGISTDNTTRTGTNVCNNTFLNCTGAGLFISAVDATTKIQNNIFINCLTAASVTSAAIRSNNGYFGCSTNQGCIGGGCAVEQGAIYVDPDLDSLYRPRSAQYRRTGATYSGLDYYGKKLFTNPNIGAVDDYATKLTATVKSEISGVLTDTVNSMPVNYPVYYQNMDSYTVGKRTGQATHIFASKRSLSASASEDIALNGSLTNAFGEVIYLSKIYELIVVSETTNDLNVGGAAANAVSSLFGNSNDIVKVKPGGFFRASSEAGYDVVAGTADILKIANAGASTSNYTLIIAGSE